MITVSPGVQIMVVNTCVSFTCRLKGMLTLCRDVLSVEPMNGGYFVFRNRSGKMLRIIFYDGDGFWMCEKIFSEGKVQRWFSDGENGLTAICARELAVLLWHGDPVGSSFPPYWKKIS